MRTVSNIITILCFAYSAYTLPRAWLVFRYRNKVLKVVSACCDHDIDLGREWHWRFEVYERASFNKMMYYFWRRIGSHYPDKSFIDPNATGPKLIHFDKYTAPKSWQI